MTARPPDWRSPIAGACRVARGTVTWRDILHARRAIRRVQTAAIVEQFAGPRTDGDRHAKRSATLEDRALDDILAADERAILLELMADWGLR